MGTRDRAAGLDFSGVLEEEVESALKEAAQISMGTEISAEDLENIQALSDQVRGLRGCMGSGDSKPRVLYVLGGCEAGGLVQRAGATRKRSRASVATPPAQCPR